MAKLKAPLLSFGASGAIAKAIVYFGWKGLNKTALFNSEDAVIVTQEATATIAGLTPGVKYFVQFRPAPADPAEGARSGIYHGRPTA